MLWGQVLGAEVVIDIEPFEGLQVLPSVLQHVADDVGPPGLLLMVPGRRRAPVRRLRLAELRFLPSHF